METKSIIEINGLNYIYPDGTNALSSINLTVAPGESVALIGANGAGKSTLLLHLNGILNGGDNIKIGGLAPTKKNLADIRKMVGLVFQDPDSQLFMPTVFEDAAFGPINLGLQRNDVEASVKRALAMVDMSGTEERASHHLSFGEKKRISLATILSMDPEILALDEPTANLDPRHRRELIALLCRLPQTKIIASHDLDMVGNVCSRVVIMSKGRISFDGSAKEALSNGELLEKNGL